MMLVGVGAVFVPYEKKEEKWVIREDLPRFLQSKDVIYFLYKNPRVSWRKEAGGVIRQVVLEWREHTESEALREYAEGVGTREMNLKRFGRSVY